MRLYVGNFPYSTTKDQLSELFASFGEMIEVRVNTNPDGKPAGFGFVEFREAHAAQNAIAQLHDADFGGRRLKVSPARPKPQRSGGSDRGSQNSDRDRGRGRRRDEDY